MGYVQNYIAIQSGQSISFAQTSSVPLYCITLYQNFVYTKSGILVLQHYFIATKKFVHFS